jgi:hypothetical protein
VPSAEIRETTVTPDAGGSIVRLHISDAPLADEHTPAKSRKITYGVLPFEHEPEWLPGGFDPKTIPDQNG